MVPNPLNVLHVISGVSPRFGGPAATLRLCGELVRQGLLVSLYTNDLDRPGSWFRRPQRGRPASQDLQSHCGVNLRVFQTQWPSRFGYAPGLGRELRHRINDFDIVHIHGLYLYPSSVAARAARRAGVPYIIEPHGSLAPVIYGHHWFRKRLFELVVERRNLRHAAGLHFATHREMQQARLHGFGTRGFVAPLGVDCREFDRLPSQEQFLSRYPELRGKQLISFIGRITRKKGLDLLSEAFSRLAQGLPDARLVIAGPDDEGFGETVKRLNSKGGVAGRVTFTGMLQGDEMRSLMAATSVWVLPSYDENFGIAVVEAMAAGLPIIVSDKVHISPELKGADAALVVPCNVGHLMRTLRLALSNDALRASLGANAKKLAHTEFTIERWAQRLCEVYEVLRRGGTDRTSAGTNQFALGRSIG